MADEASKKTECYDKQWKKQYDKLVEFKRKNGHCILPRNYGQDKSLGVWVATQQGSHTRKEIRPARKDLLDNLEFDWRVEIEASTSLGYYDDKKWSMKYDKLVDFKRKNGHCMVSQNYGQDKSLGVWVATQRALHTRNEIRLDRKDRLDNLEFVWRVEIADKDCENVSDSTKPLDHTQLLHAESASFATLAQVSIYGAGRWM
jgi:hypothetical protein